MYHPLLVSRAQSALERAYRSVLPAGLVRYPVDQCAHLVKQLAGAVNAEGQRVRRLSPEEVAFIVNEQLLTPIDYRYCAERYHSINSEGQGLKRLFPLWESQEIILGRLGTLQLDRVTSGHPDGVLANILKARQEGCSTIAQSLIVHRVTTHTHVRAIVASDVPENSGSEGLFGMAERIVANLPWFLKPREQFHKKDHHIAFENGSWIVVESGKSMKGGLQDEGGQKGNLGRSKTFSVLHLSELSTWERGSQIDDGLMPAVPRSPRTLGIKESTAKGRHNWHHEDWLLDAAGKSRFIALFLPWYAISSKYWLPAPLDWSPDNLTLQHAQQAEKEGPQWLGRSVSLSRNQLYWYQQERERYLAKNMLGRFLEEYASDPESCFQASGRSIFGIAQLQHLDFLAHPPIDVWTVHPAPDLHALKEEDLASRRRMQALATTEGDTQPGVAHEVAPV